jgi:hypothetical protein
VTLAFLASCVEEVVLGRECPGPACIDASAPILDAGGCAVSDASSCTCEVRATAILGHWPLDERSGNSARDVAGARTGTLRHSAGQMPWVSGRIGGALFFDGIDDAVQIGAVDGALRSLSFWIDARGTSVDTERTALLLPSAHGPLNEWMSPELAYADDDMAATTASLAGTRSQHWGGFHLPSQLPEGALLRGITVTVDTGNLGLLGGLSVELSWDAGATHTASNYGWGQLIVGSNLRQAGGVDKLWGRTWTPSELSDDNFRVRASFGGLVNAMAVDYVGVTIEYAPQTLGRILIGLRPGVYVAFIGGTLQTVGWPATTLVNGVANGSLREGWNHIAVIGQSALSASDVQLGAAALETLSFPFDGLMDDVLFFGEALTASQVEGLARAPGCDR